MAIARTKEAAGEIGVKSIISNRTFQPLVEMSWGDLKAQLSLDEARQHAMYILECAEAAESDAFVFQLLTRDIIGTDEDQLKNWNKMIMEFQAFREARKRGPLT